MKNQWTINKIQFLLLSVYSAIYPASIAILNTHQPYSWIGNIGMFLTFPFLPILGTLMMFLDVLQVGIVGFNLLCWLIVFIQAWLAFISVRCLFPKKTKV